MQNKNVLIVGNSYSTAVAFFYLQKYLDKSRIPYDIILISEQRSFFYHGLLPEFLMGQCSLDEITQEFRKIGYMRPGISLMDSRLLEIDFHNKTVETTKGTIHFDYLILAPEFDETKTPFPVEWHGILNVHTLLDIVNLKQHIKTVFEKAAYEKNIDIKRALLTFSIIGANQYGIEIAFALTDYILYLLNTQYYEIKKSFITINLIDEQKNINIPNSSFYSNYVHYNLNSKGIKLVLGKKIHKVEEGKISLEGENIFSSTIIATTTYDVSSLLKSVLTLKTEKTETCQKIETDKCFLLPEKSHVYLIGETSLIPGVANYSIVTYHEQAKICAQNIVSEINNDPLKPFKNTTDIDTFTLGSKNSFVNLNKVRFSGFLGWIIFRLAYIFMFLGNKKTTKALNVFASFLFRLKDYDTTEILNENMKQFNTRILSKK